MSRGNLTTSASERNALPASRSEATIRVAVLCDLREEGWPSMDLTADMLCRHLTQDCAGQLAITQLRPPLRRRFTRFPMLPKQTAWNADRLLNRFRDYPRWMHGRHDQYDLFHVVDHSYSQLVPHLPPGRTIVTCHDLDTFRCILEPEKEVRPRWFQKMTRRILDGFRQAAQVIAVSAATRNELLQYDLVSPERVTVVPNGVDPVCSPLPNPPVEEALTRLLPQAAGDTIWLLNVGSTAPRKRLDLLLHIFAEIHRRIPSTRLLRVGGELTQPLRRLACELRVDQAIVNLPFLDRNVVAAAYRRAALLLHTADAEGFGLPLVEAMACGCPVVASDLPVLREVGGGAAAYCRVGEVDQWVKNVVELLQQRMLRSASWESLIQQGVDRAAGFSWSAQSHKTLDVYRQVLARHLSA